MTKVAIYVYQYEQLDELEKMKRLWIDPEGFLRIIVEVDENWINSNGNVEGDN